MKKLFFILLLIFSLSNAAILKSPGDCIATADNPNPPDKNICYHEVAISYSVAGDKANAIAYCYEIELIDPANINLLGQSARCFKEIAINFARNGDTNAAAICGNIPSGFHDMIELCLEEVEAEQKLIENRESFCATAFIFPLMFIGLLFFRSLIH